MALSPDALEGIYTHLTTQAVHDYIREWSYLTVHGCRPDKDAEILVVPTLHLFPSGDVTRAVASKRRSWGCVRFLISAARPTASP